jgi:hypothetical protein
MPYGSRTGNPVVAALLRRDRDPRPPLQVANGTRADTMPGPQVRDEDAATATRTAWLPVMPGQPVPMIGEEVPDVDPGYDE